MMIRCRSITRSLSRSQSERHDGATGNVQNHPGDPRTLIRGEEEGCARHVVRYAKAFNRVELDELRLLSVWYARAIAIGEDGLWRDAIHADPERTGLGGDIQREDLNTCCGR